MKKKILQYFFSPKKCEPEESENGFSICNSPHMTFLAMPPPKHTKKRGGGTALK